MISSLFASALLLGPPLQGEALHLKFQPGQKTQYRIHRVWRATPADAGNGNQTHDLQIALSSPTAKHLMITFLDFQGHADAPIDRGISKGIAQNGRAIRNLRLVHDSGRDSRLPQWEFEGGNGAGWLGMMSAKACGQFEVGPFELHYPKEPIPVGTGWRAPVRVGNEGIDGMVWAKGYVPMCAYRLESVNTKANTARITFKVVANITAGYKDFTGRPLPYAEKVTQSGEWTVKLSDGTPTRFRSKTIRQASPQKVIETATTDLRRIG